MLVVAGFGYGMLNPTSTKAAMAWSRRRAPRHAVGLKQVGLPLGGMLGAALMPPLALGLGWRTGVVASGRADRRRAVATWSSIATRPPGMPAAVGGRAGDGERAGNRDLWLCRSPPGLRGDADGVDVVPRALPAGRASRLTLLAASRLSRAGPVRRHDGRVLFGMLSDRLFGGRRRMPLVLAGVGSTVCTLADPVDRRRRALGLAALAVVFGVVGIGWNGVQHTRMAELAGPRAAGTAVGLGLAISSFGVTICPPISAWPRSAWAASARLGRARGRNGARALLLVPVRERIWRDLVTARPGPRLIILAAAFVSSSGSSWAPPPSP